ncbi:MAG: sulfotransferase family 2 domain-containing protein, partial [Bdellovibrionales bacterium]|nr:sulfotransferase family 2 domain-containing protein [Bdellovibrionales bacterium]
KQYTEQVVALVQELLSIERSHDALDIVNKALSKFPNNTKLLYPRALALLGIGETKKARQALQVLCVSSPEHLEAKALLKQIEGTENPRTVARALAYEMPDPGYLLYFVQITQTGARVINWIMEREYRVPGYIRHNNLTALIADLNRLSEERKGKLHCVTGHAVFHGVNRYFDSDYRYASIVRDPVERVLSEFSFLKGDLPIYMRKDVAMGKVTLEDFASEYPNAQSRPFIGLPYHQRRPPKEQDIDQILKNLQDNWAFVGLSEFLEESVFMLRKKLGWSCNHFWGENPTTPIRADLSEISEEMRAIIAENNNVDRLLYEHVSQLFHQSIKELSASELEELQSYKVERALFSKLKQVPGLKVHYEVLRALATSDVRSIVFVASLPEYVGLIQNFLNKIELLIERDLSVEGLTHEVEGKDYSINPSTPGAKTILTADRVVFIPPTGKHYLLKDALLTLGVPLKKLICGMWPEWL